tara:strand:- start:285 stop:503 length:219 start_codon:yes stop_codon:yes gene_type:complete
MKFWWNDKEDDEEPKIQSVANFVIKLKQDRNKEYIVAEVRVQADTSKELKQMLDEGCKVADEKCYLLNNGGE